MANCRAHRGRGRNEQVPGDELRPWLAHYERRCNFHVRDHRCFTNFSSTPWHLVHSYHRVLFHVSLYTLPRDGVAMTLRLRRLRRKNSFTGAINSQTREEPRGWHEGKRYIVRLTVEVSALSRPITQAVCSFLLGLLQRGTCGGDV